MKKTFIAILIISFAGVAMAGPPTPPPKWHYNSSGELVPIKSGVTVSPGTVGDTTVNDTLTITDGTDTHIIKAVQETGLGGRLTIGLDETARTMVLTDYSNIDTDLGLDTTYSQYGSTLYLFDYDDDSSLMIGWLADDQPAIKASAGSLRFVSTNLRLESDNYYLSLGATTDFIVKWDSTFSTSDEVPTIAYPESNGGTGASDSIPILNIGDASMGALTTDTSNIDKTEPGIRIWTDDAAGWLLIDHNNSDDTQAQITVGGNTTRVSFPNIELSIPVTLEEDAGAVVLFNLPVSATPAAGTEQSKTLQIDSDNILKAYAEADSSGGIDTKRTILYSALTMSPVTETVTTEADISDPLESSVYLVNGDDDEDNDTIQLQDGHVAGEKVTFIAGTGIDGTDTMTIDTTTDSTCTNCPAIAFDKQGENATLIWTGATWTVIAIQTSL